MPVGRESSAQDEIAYQIALTVSPINPRIKRVDDDRILANCALLVLNRRGVDNERVRPEHTHAVVDLEAALRGDVVACDDRQHGVAVDQPQDRPAALGAYRPEPAWNAGRIARLETHAHRGGVHFEADVGAAVALRAAAAAVLDALPPFGIVDTQQRTALVGAERAVDSQIPCGAVRALGAR